MPEFYWLFIGYASRHARYIIEREPTAERIAELKSKRFRVKWDSAPTAGQALRYAEETFFAYAEGRA